MKFNKHINIDGFEINNDARTFFIAEAGVNHNGDMTVAKRLVDIAVEAGADAVKFQSFKTESLILPNVEKANYQQQTTDAGESQYEMLKKLEISIEQTEELKIYCEKMGITFLTTPFDEDSLDELDRLNLAAYKIASTDTTNIEFLRKVALKGKPIILSTGMCYLQEITKVLEAIHPINQDVILLQCTANYPIANEEANLNVLRTFNESYDMILGYSDHSVGVGAAPYAIPLGAKVLEKHFTNDKSQAGPDHNASLSPEELKQFVEEIRRVESYLGSATKQPTPSEEKNRKKLQKCLVTAQGITAGATITSEDIIGKRTGGIGVSVINFDDIVGTTAKRDYQPNEIFDA